MYSRILVPISLENDGPALGERALILAARLLNEGGQIRLLAVLPEAGRVLSDRRDDAHERDAEVLGADRQLRDIAAKHKDLDIETHTNAGADPAKAIIDEASKVADAIVMPSHGHHGVKGVVLGSVATEVARHASVPVVVFAGADR